MHLIAAETVGTVRSHRLQWIRGGRVFVCGGEVYCGGNWKITAGPHRSLPGMQKVQIRLRSCFKFTSRFWFLQMPTLLEMNYLSRVWIMWKTLPWITFSASVAFSLVISISLHFPPINNEMTPLEMQDRWLKWDIIFVETTQNRGCSNQINMPRDLIRYFFLFSWRERVFLNCTTVQQRTFLNLKVWK